MRLGGALVALHRALWRALGCAWPCSLPRTPWLDFQDEVFSEAGHFLLFLQKEAKAVTGYPLLCFHVIGGREQTRQAQHRSVEGWLFASGGDL